MYRQKCATRLWSGIGRSVLISLVLVLPATAQTLSSQVGNKSERLEWFRDQGLGLFIHWSVDSQLGVVISHSLAGASPKYVNDFYTTLPQTFNPVHFDPDSLATLARVAGFRYMMFTTKHHNGFCMWDTQTTSFNIMKTPFGKDITAELFAAFRKQGVGVGAYFSPDDFLWLHENGKEIERLVPGVQPSANPGLLARDRAQMTELMSHYGPMSAVFFDGEAKGLRDIVWKLQPDAVVTRGAIETPEQNVPGAPLEGAWEANMTIGSAWGYQPSDESYKSVQELIHILVQTRSRGGNLLLNVGLKADGSLPVEQEERLQTLGSWMFINGDAIYGTRPWVVTNEGDVWFTRSRDRHALYAIVDDGVAWKRGTWREFVLKTAKATPQTTAGLLGQNDRTVEYRPDLKPTNTFHQEADGLHVRVMRAQRLRDSDEWEYPSVIKLTNVEEAFVPPVVHTLKASSSGHQSILKGSWSEAATAEGAKFGFEVRVITGEDAQSRLHGWQKLPLQQASVPGEYTASFTPETGEQYEYRAVLQHPLLTLYGETVALPSR